MKKHYWSKEEVDFLKNSWNRFSIKFIAKKLGRTECAIRNKAYKLDLIAIVINCECCDKKFLKDTNQKYCSECAKKQVQIRKNYYYEINRDDIIAKRNLEKEQNQFKELNLICKNESLKKLFELYCLSISKSEGIHKIKKFTGREDAELIYKNLREEFIKSSYF